MIVRLIDPLGFQNQLHTEPLDLQIPRRIPERRRLHLPDVPGLQPHGSDDRLLHGREPPFFRSRLLHDFLHRGTRREPSLATPPVERATNQLHFLESREPGRETIARWTFPGPLRNDVRHWLRFGRDRRDRHRSRHFRFTARDPHPSLCFATPPLATLAPHVALSTRDSASQTPQAQPAMELTDRPREDQYRWPTASTLAPPPKPRRPHRSRPRTSTPTAPRPAP